VTRTSRKLVTERDLFDAELLLAQAWRDEILAVVRLYKVLGGGWQTEPPPPAATATSEPRPRNVGPSAAEEGTVPRGDSAGVHAGRLSVADERAANGAGAEGGGPAAGSGDRTTWGSVKTFFGSLFSR
jgi:hypothetical protein